MHFDPHPRLTGHGLDLRPISPDDLELLFAAASDPGIWEGHPARDRFRRAVFEPYFGFLSHAGGTLVVRDTNTQETIGCSRFYGLPGQPDEIGVGFTFLVRAAWGGKVNFDLKRLMLGHIFAGRPRAWFHIDPNNIRSQKATAKLGAVQVGEEVLDLGTGPAPWKTYRLDRQAWQSRLERAQT